MNKEIELKYRLSGQEDFLALVKFLEQYRCAPALVLHQENCYFDTPMLSMRAAGISLRLRKQNEEYFLSAKASSGQRTKKHLSIRHEFEEKITTDIAQLIHKNYLSPLEVFMAADSDPQVSKKILHATMKKNSATGLGMIGRFTNIRTSIPIDLVGHRILFEMDHSFYPKNIELFEVEIELASVRDVDIIRPALEKLFRAAGVKTYRSCSKSSRLLRILFDKD